MSAAWRSGTKCLSPLGFPFDLPATSTPNPKFASEVAARVCEPRNRDTGLLSDPVVITRDPVHHFPRQRVHLFRQYARLFRAVAPVLDVVEQVGEHGEPLSQPSGQRGDSARSSSVTCQRGGASPPAESVPQEPRTRESNLHKNAAPSLLAAFGATRRDHEKIVEPASSDIAAGAVAKLMTSMKPMVKIGALEDRALDDAEPRKGPA
jgi:hypothetical protein